MIRSLSASRRKILVTVAASTALAATALLTPSYAQAEPHNNPATCTVDSNSWSYKDKSAQTIKIKVKVSNYGDYNTGCKVIIGIGPDSGCVAIRAGGTYTFNLYRASISYFQKMAKC